MQSANANTKTLARSSHLSTPIASLISQLTPHQCDAAQIWHRDPSHLRQLIGYATQTQNFALAHSIAQEFRLNWPEDVSLLLSELQLAIATKNANHIEKIKARLKLDDGFEAQVGAALAEQALGHWPCAEQSFIQAFSAASPDEKKWLWLRLAQLHLSAPSKNLNKAAYYLRQAKSHFPKDIEVRALLAYWHFLAGNKSQALQRVDQLMDEVTPALLALRQAIENNNKAFIFYPEPEQPEVCPEVAAFAKRHGPPRI